MNTSTSFQKGKIEAAELWLVNVDCGIWAIFEKGSIGDSKCGASGRLRGENRPGDSIKLECEGLGAGVPRSETVKHPTADGVALYCQHSIIHTDQFYQPHTGSGAGDIQHSARDRMALRPSFDLLGHYRVSPDFES